MFEKMPQADALRTREASEVDEREQKTDTVGVSVYGVISAELITRVEVLADIKLEGLLAAIGDVTGRTAKMADETLTIEHILKAGHVRVMLIDDRYQAKVTYWVKFNGWLVQVANARFRPTDSLLDTIEYFNGVPGVGGRESDCNREMLWTVMTSNYENTRWVDAHLWSNFEADDIFQVSNETSLQEFRCSRDLHIVFEHDWADDVSAEGPLDDFLVFDDLSSLESYIEDCVRAPAREVDIQLEADIYNPEFDEWLMQLQYDIFEFPGDRAAT